MGGQGRGAKSFRGALGRGAEGVWASYGGVGAAGEGGKAVKSRQALPPPLNSS